MGCPAKGCCWRLPSRTWGIGSRHVCEHPGSCLFVVMYIFGPPVPFLWWAPFPACCRPPDAGILPVQQNSSLPVKFSELAWGHGFRFMKLANRSQCFILGITAIVIFNLRTHAPLPWCTPTHFLCVKVNSKTPSGHSWQASQPHPLGTVSSGVVTVTEHTQGHGDLNACTLMA